MIQNIKDIRCPAFPDRPYSGYCQVCWFPVYQLWIDYKHDHRGRCPEGCESAGECPVAEGFAKSTRDIKEAARKLSDES